MHLSNQNPAEAIAEVGMIELSPTELTAVSGGEDVAVAAVHGKNCTAETHTDATGGSYVVITCQ